jgi:hypothetical protein
VVGELNRVVVYWFFGLRAGDPRLTVAAIPFLFFGFWE